MNTVIRIAEKSIFIVVLLLLSKDVKGLEINNNNNAISRREGLSRFARTLGSATILPLTASIISKGAAPAQAACMPGDLNTNCIGVYKLPYEDAKDSFFLNNKDALKEFAPDMNFVPLAPPPETVGKARDQLYAQRKEANGIREVVFDGNLQEAGVRVLNLIPKITGAGTVVKQQVQSKADESGAREQLKKALKFENQLEELIVQWSSIDIEIGQALRGQRGISAVAQIEILRDLKEANQVFDDFLLLVEANTK